MHNNLKSSQLIIILTRVNEQLSAYYFIWFAVYYENKIDRKGLISPHAPPPPISVRRFENICGKKSNFSIKIKIN